MSAVFPLTFLSLQKAEPHKQVLAPTNEERLQAFRRFAPVLYTNNTYFPRSPANTPAALPSGGGAPSTFEDLK